MLKQVFLIFVIVFSFFCRVSAQDFDNNPTVNIVNKNDDMRFTIGARFMADAAYYPTGKSLLNSGAAITDARIRTSMTYHNWYFYADFDFSRGKFGQKNMFLQYTANKAKGDHILKIGYYNNPATMANNTSRGSLHFISRAAPVNMLAPGRELGVSYIFYNKHFLAYQGVFAENKYNDQISGYQGPTFGGRWVWRPINETGQTLHVGTAFRYARINTGVKTNDVLRTDLLLSTTLETYVDQTTRYMIADQPWAKDDYYCSGEVLYLKNRGFVRGEYLFRHIDKKRDDQKLFDSQLDTDGAFSTIGEWRAANPLSANTFHGGYIEGGFKIKGGNYAYSNVDGVLKGNSTRAFEVVGRYSYVNMGDKPSPDADFTGGDFHAATVGVNYVFNQYVKWLFSYSFMHTDEYNFNILQTRILFQF